MRVTLTSFGGLIPRYSRHHLGPIQASVAHDVKLRNGRLEAWRELCDYAAVPPTRRSFALHGCCALSWDELVTMAEVSPDWGRVYISGRKLQLEAIVVDPCTCDMEYFYVGVPAPMSPPIASAGETCDRDTDSRAYVYTYINQWFEESAPSPPSNVVRVADGVSVSVSGIALPPDGYGIVGAKIYRASTGFREDNVKTQKPVTDFQFVGIHYFPSTTFVDTVKGIGLGEVLETEKVRMPPACLQQVVSLDGVVRLAGFYKNKVFLSENFQLHNWPVKYDLTLNHNIVHMGQQDRKLYITTDSIPYIVDASGCEDLKCTPVFTGDTPLPDIGCQYQSGAIMTPHGYVYSSPLGVILFSENTKWVILTARWLSEDDWRQVLPETARFAYWEGFLFIATDMVTLLLDINGDPYGDMDKAELSTLSDRPIDMKVSRTGQLFFMQDGHISVWNTGDELRKFVWESRELTGDNHNPQESIPTAAPAYGATWSPASAKIRSSDTTFTLSTPLQPVAYTRKVVTDDPFRLPRVGRHLWYKIKLEGTDPVEFAELGTSHFTVNAGE